MGIVNGTTNFILTKMSQNGAAYDEVLKQAQELGFAEADPTSDVEGLDAARKMMILATLGFSMEMDLEMSPSRDSRPLQKKIFNMENNLATR